MFTTKTIVKIIVGVSTLGCIVTYARIVMSEVAIMELHPDVPDRTIIVAHRRFLKDVMTGKVELPSDYTDDHIDDYFMENYVTPLMSE